MQVYKEGRLKYLSFHIWSRGPEGPPEPPEPKDP